MFNERVNTVTKHTQTYMNRVKICEIFLVYKVDYYLLIVLFTKICSCMLLRGKRCVIIRQN